MKQNSLEYGAGQNKARTDLIIEAEGIEAGKAKTGEAAEERATEPAGVKVWEEWKEEHSMKVTVVQISDEEGAKAMERAMGTYITIELPELLKEEETLKERAELELSSQLAALLKGKKSEHMLVVGLGNREVTADAVGPLTIDGLLVTGHYFLEESLRPAMEKKYRKVSAFVPGVMAQTGIETMELIRGVLKETMPDVVVVIDALAARSPKRLNTTIQLTDTGIRPGAGVGNNRKELNEQSLGCPVIAIGVPTVLDAAAIARDEVVEDVKNFFVMPGNVDSAVQYVSELLAGGINRVNQKTGI